MKIQTAAMVNLITNKTPTQDFMNSSVNGMNALARSSNLRYRLDHRRSSAFTACVPGHFTHGGKASPAGMTMITMNIEAVWITASNCSTQQRHHRFHC